MNLDFTPHELAFRDQEFLRTELPAGVSRRILSGLPPAPTGLACGGTDFQLQRFIHAGAMRAAA